MGFTNILFGDTDFSFVMCPITRKSDTGYVVFMNHGDNVIHKQHVDEILIIWHFDKIERTLRRRGRHHHSFVESKVWWWRPLRRRVRRWQRTRSWYGHGYPEDGDSENDYQWSQECVTKGMMVHTIRREFQEIEGDDDEKFFVLCIFNEGKGYRQIFLTSIPLISILYFFNVFVCCISIQR